MSNIRSMRIRQLASSRSGERIAAGEFEREVHIWNVRTCEFVRRFSTILDFGGTRLAISSDGGSCVTGSYERGSIACYDLSSGAEQWRKDIQNPQYASFMVNDKQVIIGTDDNCVVVNREDGATIETYRGIHSLIESPWQRVVLFNGKEMELRGVQGVRQIIPRLTFAELGAAFSPKYVCISESTGPVRCCAVQSGAEVWRHYERGRHVVRLCYSQSQDAFVAVDLAYEVEGTYRLIRFDASSGHIGVITELKDAWEAAFCLEGSRLITGGGSIIDTTTGVIVGHLWS